MYDVGRRLHTASEPICPLRKRLGAYVFSSLPPAANGRQRPPSEASARAAKRERLQAYKKAQARYWSEVINQGKERGEIRKEVATEALYNVFYSVYVGIAFHGAIIDRQFVLDQLREEWDFLYQLAAAH